MLQGFKGMTALQHHEYRCYRFWKYPSFTLIWTGIGTGCLEPLMFEILEPRIVRRIVLIGTAGAISNRTALGQGCVITEAFLGCTGISIRLGVKLVPRWNAGLPDLPSATIVSTDYYYGFSRLRSPLVKALQDADVKLKGVMGSALDAVDLVDMEVAQFYHFCRVLGGNPLEYVALKGAANPITDVSEQVVHSESLLVSLSHKAREILGDGGSRQETLDPRPI